MNRSFEKEDPSRFFTGFDFVSTAEKLPLRQEAIPSFIAPNLGGRQMFIREGLLQAYFDLANQLINSKKITPPTVYLDRFLNTALIVNKGRGKRPEGESEQIPIIPGNERSTPPALLVVPKNNSGEWLIRVFFNAYPYGYPLREVKEDTPSKKIETVCALSLVAALNPKMQPLDDPDYRNREMLELLLYTIASTSRLIMEHGDYLHLDKGRRETRRFDAVLGFINQGKTAGGSLPWPHAQVIAFPRENAQPVFLGAQNRETGQCGRCEGAKRKIEQKSERLIVAGDYSLMYVPQTEAAAKGDIFRVTSTHHFANYLEASRNPEVFVEIAKNVHKAMRALAIRQKASGAPEASYNVIFGQDCIDNTSHLFIDVRTGNPSGGFGIVTPMYERIVPNVVYQDPVDAARETRQLIIFR